MIPSNDRTCIPWTTEGLAPITRMPPSVPMAMSAYVAPLFGANISAIVYTVRVGAMIDGSVAIRLALGPTAEVWRTPPCRWTMPASSSTQPGSSSPPLQQAGVQLSVFTFEMWLNSAPGS